MKAVKLFDLDDSLVKTRPDNNYSLKSAPAIEANVLLLKHFYYEGHEIVIYTARDWWQKDEIAKWLNKHKIPFHSIICGKPVGELWDDRVRNINCPNCRSHA